MICAANYPAKSGETAFRTSGAAYGKLAEIGVAENETNLTIKSVAGGSRCISNPKPKGDRMPYRALGDF